MEDVKAMMETAINLLWCRNVLILSKRMNISQIASMGMTIGV
jgi:hypothetical protein